MIAGTRPTTVGPRPSLPAIGGAGLAQMAMAAVLALSWLPATAAWDPA